MGINSITTIMMTNNNMKMRDITSIEDLKINTTQIVLRSLTSMNKNSKAIKSSITKDIFIINLIISTIIIISLSRNIEKKSS
jgi:hypothetical protein